MNGYIPKISTLKGWSARYKWIERCIAWDNHLLAERDKVRAKYAAMNERRRIKTLEVNYDAAQRLRAKAMKMLDFPLKMKKIEKDGKTIHIHPARWQMSTIADMLKLAAEIEHAVLEATAPPLDRCSIGELTAMRDASDRSLREVVEAAERGDDS